MSAADRTQPSYIDQTFDVRGLGVLVTGAASGLGFAFARALGSSGARVSMIDLQEERLRRAADELRAAGCEVRTAVADIRDPEQVEAAMSAAAQWEGGLDVVFANAGISAGKGRSFGEGTIERTELESWKRVLDVNLTGTFITMKAAARHLNDGGSIVVTSSIAGHRADSLVGYAYSASKAAVSHLVKNVAHELADRGIRVNGIAPGSVLTEIGRVNPNNGEMLSALEQATALKRLADPRELEGLALLLASQASSHITGAILVVDGGVLVT